MKENGPDNKSAALVAADRPSGLSLDELKRAMDPSATWDAPAGGGILKRG